MSASPLNPEPFRIEPVFSSRIWGAKSLAPLFPGKTNLAEPLGEAWLTGIDCKIATGPFAGKSLGETWRGMPANWRGTRLASVPDFPLLVKFIFPRDKLSVQVHPDDAYASKYEKAAGGRGKTEMWHALSADPGASVMIGLVPEADVEKLLAAIKTQALDDLFVHWRVQPGDTFFVPAGTPHTIGPGMILCEVQEYSDLTYRVYDYGRVDAQGNPRELHIEKALEVIEFGRPIRGKTSRIHLTGHGSQKYLLAACPYFATEQWKDSTRIESHSSEEHFDLLVILTGRGDLIWNSGLAEYRSGECWLIPAGLGQFALNPKEPTKLLRTYVPDLPRLRASLEQKGHSWQELSKTVFD
ncbi:MAG TPA: class I mannose-6-phosphate isomerase [Candidatus Acidoferrum sp.]|nr:class I mannose-6-phosphate isomerase [Candidatus Acidoferrum sp.]